MKKKSLIALILAGIMAASVLSGCGNSGGEAEKASSAKSEASVSSAAEASAVSEAKSEAPAAATGLVRPTTNGKAENALYLSIVQAPNNLDPQLFTLQAESIVVAQMYEPLFILGPDGAPEYILIEDMVPAEDDSSVAFTLKEGVKFHSGDPLTAEDVAYTLTRCENSAICSPLFQFAEIEIEDDLHFKMNFPAAAEGAGFSAVMAYMPSFDIVNKSFCEEVLASKDDNLLFNCDGTGAYMLDSIDTTGNVVLKRFADYHGEASIDTLNFAVISGSQELAFEAGDIDYAMYAGSTYQTIKEYDNVYAYEQPVNSSTFLTTNCVDGSITSDIKVREAMAHLINREDVAVVATDDSGLPAYNMANPVTEFYADCCTHYELDVETANALMTEAGYSANKKAEITLIVPGAYPNWVAACAIIKDNLEQSYFTVKIEELPDTNRFFIQDYDIGFISIGLTTSFLSYSMLFDATSGLNISGAPESVTTPVLEAFTGANDEESIHKAMNTVVESLVYIPLCYTSTFLAYDGDLNVGPFYVDSGTMYYRTFSWK